MVLKCVNCKSKKIVKRGFRHNEVGKKQKYLCLNCEKWFVEPDGFERMRHKPKDIVRAIHMYNDGFSLFKTQYHLYQHNGVKVSREAIRLWCKKYENFLKFSEKKGKTKVKRQTAS